MGSFEKTMKTKSIPAPFIIFLSTLCRLLPATAVAQQLISRSTTTISYIERGVA